MRNSMSFKGSRHLQALLPCLAIALLALLSLVPTGAQAQANPCDINGDGVVNLSDIALFAQLYNTGVYDPRIDLNGDGVINLIDLSMFVACF